MWWDAWAAVGTIAAVITALGLARAEACRRRRDERGRSMWVAISIRPGLVGWLSRIAEVRQALDGKGDSDRLELIHREPGDFLRPPSVIREMRMDIPMLGSTAEPLAQGTFLLTEVLADWENLDAVLHGSVLEPEASKILKSAKMKIDSAYELIARVEADVCERLRQPRLSRLAGYISPSRGRRQRPT